MLWIILSAAAAIAIPFIVPMLAPASRVGAAVSARFLERPGGIPAEPSSPPVPIDAKSLRAWATAAGTSAYARAYARNVMPIDLLYILAFGGFLALAAHTLATSGIAPHNPLGKVPVLLWLALPALYALADLFEDALIFALLTRPSVITEASVGLLAVLRGTKIGSSALALLQLFVLGLGGLLPIG